MSRYAIRSSGINSLMIEQRVVVSITIEIKYIPCRHVNPSTDSPTETFRQTFRIQPRISEIFRRISWFFSLSSFLLILFSITCFASMLLNHKELTISEEISTFDEFFCLITFNGRTFFMNIIYESDEGIC